MPETSPVLNPEKEQQLRDLCQQGYRLYDDANYKTALRYFYRAWQQLPRPQQQWRQAGWVLTALGDTYFCNSQYQQAIEALKSALCCPEADINPFIHMRLSQCYIELGDNVAARNSLALVKHYSGSSLLEAQGEKYRDFIANNAN